MGELWCGVPPREGPKFSSCSVSKRGGSQISVRFCILVSLITLLLNSGNRLLMSINSKPDIVLSNSVNNRISQGSIRSDLVVGLSK